MWEQITKWLSVFFFSMIKFIGGPLTAAALGLTPLETILLSVLGMMTSVFIFSRIGTWFKTNIIDKLRKPVLFTAKNRKLVSLWGKYGITGVAFLTPVIFSPIVGTMLATSFGETRQRIFLYMLVSAIFWALVLTFSLAQLQNLFSLLKF
jgi:membrane protein DedA with SNARE-associated domain